MSRAEAEPLSDVSEDIQAAIQDVARHLGCPESYVHTAMKGLPAPNWCTPDHQNAVRDAAEAHNLALQHAKELADALHKISEKDREMLIAGGCITLQQVRHLVKELDEAGEFYGSYYQQFPRVGGKNHAALSVAKIVLRVFRIMGKPITWGTHDGSPTTDYGRAVQFALKAFGVRAGWKQAARVVRDEYDRRNFHTFAVLTKMAIERTNPNSD